MKTKNFFSIGAIALILPHLLCCGLPGVLAVMSIIAPAADVGHLHLIPEEWMSALFVLSGTTLAAGYYFTFRSHPSLNQFSSRCESRNLTTRTNRSRLITPLTGCLYARFHRHKGKDTKCKGHEHKTQKIILYGATALFVISLGVHFFGGHSH